MAVIANSEMIFAKTVLLIMNFGKMPERPDFADFEAISDTL